MKLQPLGIVPLVTGFDSVIDFDSIVGLGSVVSFEDVGGEMYSVCFRIDSDSVVWVDEDSLIFDSKYDTSE